MKVEKPKIIEPTKHPEKHEMDLSKFISAFLKVPKMPVKKDKKKK